MGDALVMFATPSEVIGHFRRARPQPHAGSPALVPVPSLAESVWHPPEEPWRELGPDWHTSGAARRAHLRAVQTSLEAFLNHHLARLDRAVRTGWFILGRARVRVTECRAAPERAPRGAPKAKSKKKSRRRTK